MMNVAAAAFPEPAPAPSTPGSKPSRQGASDAPEFDALLDAQVEPEAKSKDSVPPDQTSMDALTAGVSPVVGDEIPADVAAPETTQIKQPEVVEAASDDAEVSDKADDDKDPKVDADLPDATVLSSQLAMWQILPRPAPPVCPPAANPPAAVAEGVDVAGVKTDSAVSSTLGENISSPATTALPGEVKADATDAKVPQTPTQNLPACPKAPADTTSATDAGVQKLPVTAATPTPTAPATTATLTTNPPESGVPKEVAEVLPKDRATVAGIPVAKQHRVMSDRDLQPTATPAPAAIAGASVATHSVAEIAPVAASNGQKFQDQPREETDRQPDSALSAGVTLTSETKSHSAAEAPEFPSTARAVDATKVIDQIERAVERMRTQGSQRIEMRLPLQDGGEVLVKLHLDAGQLKAVFRTESGGLRDALEAGWSQFAAGAPERDLKVGQAVFESPSMQSNTGGFSQTPDQRSRQQAFAEAESNLNAVPVFPLSQVNPLRDLRPTSVAASSASSAAGIQLYA